MASLREAGFIEPTEIQSQAIPLVMEGEDLMASAQTGSGKTAAYALPIIARLQRTRANALSATSAGTEPPHSTSPRANSPRANSQRSTSPRALILVPTRELALQVKEQFVLFGRGLRTAAIYGGASFHNQAKLLERGTDVIVATPGRLLDMLKQGFADLRQIETLVLDEADRLMDMGFMPQVRRIVSQMPRQRQTLMFSATIDRRVEQIAAEYLEKPQLVRSSIQQVDAASVKQNVHYMHEFAKDDFLLSLLEGLGTTSVLIFTETRRKASWVTGRLRDANVSAEEIHSDVSQNKRETIMKRFRNGEFTVLVATDVAARGLDVPQIGHVVNYDLPNTAQDYVHRIGRTGRAGRSGTAHSFVSEEQRYLVRDIERLIGRTFDGAPLKSQASGGGHSKPAARRFRSGGRRRA